MSASVSPPSACRRDVFRVQPGGEPRPPHGPAKDGQSARKILGVTDHIYGFFYLRHGTVESAAAGKEGVSVIARILAFTTKDGGVVRVQVC